MLHTSYLEQFYFVFYRYLNDRMISYEASFSVEPLMSSNLGGGFQWPIGTVLSIIKTNSLDHAGNYTCAPSTLISGEREKSPYGLPKTDKSRKSA